MTIRYLDFNNNIVEKYLSLRDMSSQNAQAYLKSVLETLNEFDLLNGIYFIATDGAPVVSSQQNGLYGPLK